MRTSLRILALFGLVVLLLRCWEEIDSPIPIPDPKLVLISNFFPNELVSVELHASQSVLEGGRPQPVEDAEVEILVGNQIVEQLVFVPGTPSRLPYYTTQTFKPRVGIEYTIHAAKDGYVPITAVSAIPDPVPITFFQQLSSTSQLMEDGTRVYDLGIAIDYEDPATRNTYYHFRLVQEVEVWREIGNTGQYTLDFRYFKPVEFPRSGPIDWEVVLANSGSGVLITDKPFEGPLSLAVSSTIDENQHERLGRLFAELRVVSREYFNFQNDIIRQTNNNPGPFDDDAPSVDNNVDNGLGVFAGYNYARDTLNLDI
ncbi:MAG: DUF4249 domain-containing protein [Bacteroidota bacterium]